ncbi:MAG: flagellar basal body-associated FliL family protein [Actinomycetota bacterium]|nr:flagellar basal body-associated FliL family protein [Actinomycetota bacterium]
MAEEEEASEAEAPEEEEEKKKGGIKKILIKVIPLLLVGYFVAKMTVLKPPPPTQEEIDAAHQTELVETWAMCATENHQPFDVDDLAAEAKAKIEEEHEEAEAAEFEAEPSSSSKDDEEEADPNVEAPADEEAPAAEEEGHGAGLPGTGGLGMKALAGSRPGTAGGGPASGLNPVYDNDAVTLNLADGRYVKIKLALQLHSVVDVEALGASNYGSKAQDIVNTRLRALTVDQLQSPETVTALKYELGNTICREYHGEVTQIYFTEFVTQ